MDTSTPDWNVLFQNEAWLRITGMSRDEVFGSKMWQLFTPAGQSKVHCVHVAVSLLASFEEGLIAMCIGRVLTADCQLLALPLTSSCCFLPAVNANFAAAGSALPLICCCWLQLATHLLLLALPCYSPAAAGATNLLLPNCRSKCCSSTRRQLPSACPSHCTCTEAAPPASPPAS